MAQKAMWRIWVVVVGLGVLTAASAGPALAGNDALRVLAGLAVGALVYEALDDNNCRPAPYCRPTYNPPSRCDPYPRYDPPGYSYYWGTPREHYNEGYRDGWSDGRQQGRREGYNTGWHNGYDSGYRDGRRPQWVDDDRGRCGPPRYSHGPDRAYRR